MTSTNTYMVYRMMLNGYIVDKHYRSIPKEFTQQFYSMFNTTFIDEQIKKGAVIQDYSPKITDDECIKNIKELASIHSKQFPTFESYLMIFTNPDVDCVFSTLFYKVTNIHLIVPSMFSTTSTNTNHELLGLFHNHIKYQNLQVGFTTNIINSFIDNIITKLSEERMYDLKTYSFFDDLKLPLYNYQIDNINWMINREKEGFTYPMIFDKVLKFPDGRYLNYDRQKFLTDSEFLSTNVFNFKGGIIMDDVGIGKTVQMLSLVKHDPSVKTAILVPLHLEEHWKKQMDKHFETPFTNVTIIPFNKITSITSAYDRLIIDEIHEIFTHNLDAELFKLPKIKFRWGLSATPFPEGVKNITDILKYLMWDTSINSFYVKSYHLWPIWYNLLRSNTHESVRHQVNIDSITEKNHFINLLPMERNIYNTEKMHHSENLEKLRMICCNFHMIFDDIDPDNLVSKAHFINTTIEGYKKKFEFEQIKRDELIKNINELEEKIKQSHVMGIGNIHIFKELTESLAHYKHMLTRQLLKVESTKAQYEHISSCLEDSEECPICMDELPESFYVTKCKHFFCKSCFDLAIKTQPRCAVCKTLIGASDFKYINGADMFQTSSKISQIIKILNETSEKFIIYTQFNQIVLNLVDILNKLNIKTTILKNGIPEDFDDDTRVVVASSTTESSGIDLTYFNNMIIFEPYVHNYLYMKSYEKQIIGRINRIGQTKHCVVHRLISRDTIESDIYAEGL